MFSASAGAGLEDSCGADWLKRSDPTSGLELIEVSFHGAAYRPHRHDTYAIGITDHGIQVFDYRGETRVALPGDIVVLHPDELHDGRSGGEAGFGYRLLYIAPHLITEAVSDLSGPGNPLPFVRDPVMRTTSFVGAVETAFGSNDDPLAVDDVIHQIASGLIEADPSCRKSRTSTRIDRVAIASVRQFLDAERSRIVRSRELEQISGLSRFELARQFRRATGTSPYRYSLMRRLDAARSLLACGIPPVDVALDTGFADQAHFTRAFTASSGLSPAKYRALSTST